MQVPKPWIGCICVLFLGSLTQASKAYPHQAWNEDTPTCEELRSFWEVISRTVRLSQMTNEIPVLPLQFFADLQRQHKWKTEKNGHPKYYRKNKQAMYDVEHLQPFTSTSVQRAHSVIPSEPLLIFSPPEDPNLSIDNALDGFHDNFHPSFGSQTSIPVASSWQEEPEVLKFGSPPAFSEVKNTEEAYEPKWGNPEEANMFGKFVDMDEVAPSNDAMTRIPKESVGKWAAFHDYDTTDSHMCSEMVNKECAVDIQCVCAGWPTFWCYRGRCTNQHLSHDHANHYGTWHDGPLPKSKLGLLARLRKRNSRSIFMK